MGSCFLLEASTDVLTDSPLDDTHGVGQHIDHDTVSGISVKYRSILD